MAVSLLIAAALQASAGDPDSQQPVRLHVDKVDVEVKSANGEVKQAKDSWDKFASISTFLSGIVVALVGIAATAVYNARQLKSQSLQKERELVVQRVELVQKLLPDLASDDPRRRLGALDVIAALGDEALAAKLAQRFGGEGGASALVELARSPNSSIAFTATKALAELFSTLRASVLIIESGDPARSAATGFFVSSDGHAVVPSFALVEKPFLVKLDLSGPAYPAEVLRKSTTTELALLRVSMPAPIAPLSLTAAAVAPGDQVIALGFAAGTSWVSSVGHVVGMTGDRILSDLSLQPGMAGAPVINTRSELVGMAVATTRDQRTSTLLPAEAIVEFVQTSISEGVASETQ